MANLSYEDRKAIEKYLSENPTGVSSDFQLRSNRDANVFADSFAKAIYFFCTSVMKNFTLNVNLVCLTSKSAILFTFLMIIFF